MFWNGTTCEMLSGCSCDGSACDEGYNSLQACQSAHEGCNPVACETAYRTLNAELEGYLGQYTVVVRLAHEGLALLGFDVIHGDAHVPTTEEEARAGTARRALAPAPGCERAEWGNMYSILAGD